MPRSVSLASLPSGSRRASWTQLSLMANEAEAYAYGTKNATEEQVKVKAHARQTAERQRAGHRAGRNPHGSGGAPAFRRGTHLRCLRLGDGGDWERSPPEPEDGTGPVLDSGKMCTTPTPVSSASRRQGKEICGKHPKSPHSALAVLPLRRQWPTL